jgi:3-mercaptopyruvate sulfurtransferase SseA
MIREITKEQIDQKTAQGERVVLIEALSGAESEYDAKHIPYSMPMQVNRVRELATQYLPDTGAEIVVYGPNELSPAADTVAHLLSGMGYVNLFIYRGGKAQWFAASGHREETHKPAAPRSNLKNKGLRMVREFASGTVSNTWPAATVVRVAGKTLSSRRLAPLFRGAVWGLAIYGGIQIIKSLAQRRRERMRGTDEASEIAPSRHRIDNIDQSNDYEGSANSFHSASAAE